MGKDKEDSKKQSLSAMYNTALVQYPVLMNSLIAGILAGLGVLMSGLLVNPGEAINWGEVKVMIVVASVFTTPVLLAWYALLEKMPGGVVGKLVIDQLLFSPICTAGILAFRLLLLGTDVSEILPELIEVVPKVMGPNWLFWIPQRYLTMMFVPPNYHVIGGNICALVWNGILAVILSK